MLQLLWGIAAVRRALRGATVITTRVAALFSPHFAPLIDTLIGTWAWPWTTGALVKTLTGPLRLEALIGTRIASLIAPRTLARIEPRIGPRPAFIAHRRPRGITARTVLVEPRLPFGALFLHRLQRLTRARNALAAHGGAAFFAGP